MSEYLFSYGTLQNENVQMEVFGRKLHGTADVLKGHKTVTIEITDAAFLSKEEDINQLIAVISEDKNDNIRGTVFEVTGEELFLADKYEPGNYKRITVVLGSGKQAWVYVAVETP